MKYQQINIGGKLRPVRFSYAALYEYEQNTGRKAIEDFTKLQTEGISVTLATDLIYAGLSLGAKTVGAVPDFSVYDVSDWVFSEPGSIDATMKIFSDSFPNAVPDKEGGPDESKKVKTAKKGTG